MKKMYLETLFDFLKICISHSWYQNGFNLFLANKVYSLRTLWFCERIIASYTVLLPWLKQRKNDCFVLQSRVILIFGKTCLRALFRVEGMVLEHLMHKYFCEEWMNRTDSFITQEHNVNPLLMPSGGGSTFG